MRKVAMAASAGYVKPEEFAKFWPSGVKHKERVFSKEYIEQIKKIHKIA